MSYRRFPESSVINFLVKLIYLCFFFFFCLKDLQSIMDKAITREKELEKVCKKQAARIEELNQLV